jgi:hypothetical protein
MDNLNSADVEEAAEIAIQGQAKVRHGDITSE